MGLSRSGRARRRQSLGKFGGAKPVCASHGRKASQLPGDGIGVSSDRLDQRAQYFRALSEVQGFFFSKLQFPPKDHLLELEFRLHVHPAATASPPGS